ncbi:hypothetical protein MLP_18630 [Microlunatus phosphovorus NM-1]|uniref:Methyltransferase domain-containing protein n=1 Tax=Microlunatus phosphovorus (strain ATCC 700054 / DSM 10555 / JCM 9379 / NBRC 101784 / NCIMB 13414 / VKM Ac-1990 / NM-1) TaxID=1032480 RepID=F5XT05_MICPN|nr:class I SAM-dependent methyltransferase [Microlunatus phosphovorus]BAK34877.1 hypothetical protein MLP_18630 [Microlunatus phosphovorus NM-1]
MTATAMYSRLIHRHLAANPVPVSAALAEVERKVPHRAWVVELGCGAESVVARAFAGRADVLGVDRSADRVARARAAAPAAWFTVADLRRLPLAPASVDAVVSFFAMIHVPLAELPATLVGIVNRLRPGGFLSLALGTACSAFGADPPPSGVTCAPAAQVVALLETTGLGDVRGATASWSDADGWLEVVYVDAMRVRE